ncbi:MAG: hypothetical protein GY737_20535, partial [Desulfobacteraceae bacterium]|nr:hypothetical protein [Desulfobacteraceae bacterium]
MAAEQFKVLCQSSEDFTLQMATPTRKERLKQRKRKKKGKGGVGIVKDTTRAASVLVEGEGAIGSAMQDNGPDRQRSNKQTQGEADVVGASSGGNLNIGGISVTEDDRNDEAGVGCRTDKTNDGGHAGAVVPLMRDDVGVRESEAEGQETEEYTTGRLTSWCKLAKEAQARQETARSEKEASSAHQPKPTQNREKANCHRANQLKEAQAHQPERPEQEAVAHPMNYAEEEAQAHLPEREAEEERDEREAEEACERETRLTAKETKEAKVHHTKEAKTHPTKQAEKEALAHTKEAKTHPTKQAEKETKALQVGETEREIETEESHSTGESRQVCDSVFGDEATEETLEAEVGVFGTEQSRYICKSRDKQTAQVAECKQTVQVPECVAASVVHVSTSPREEHSRRVVQDELHRQGDNHLSVETEPRSGVSCLQSSVGVTSPQGVDTQATVREDVPSMRDESSCRQQQGNLSMHPICFMVRHDGQKKQGQSGQSHQEDGEDDKDKKEEQANDKRQDQQSEQQEMVPYTLQDMLEFVKSIENDRDRLRLLIRMLLLVRSSYAQSGDSPNSQLPHWMQWNADVKAGFAQILKWIHRFIERIFNRSATLEWPLQQHLWLHETN